MSRFAPLTDLATTYPSEVILGSFVAAALLAGLLAPGIYR